VSCLPHEISLSSTVSIGAIGIAGTDTVNRIGVLAVLDRASVTIAVAVVAPAVVGLPVINPERLHDNPAGNPVALKA
jgi:hypothetical protein